ncbi:MAG: hypothetical protein ABFS38_14385 [Bacteroidota bacterium]
MKKFSLIVIFTISFGIVSAQMSQDSRDMIRIGLNGAFFGSGDVLGISTSIEYVHQINDFLDITPRFMIANANNMYNMNTFYEYHQITSLGASLSLRITPFPDLFHRLKFDIGGLYQRFIKSWGQLGSIDMYGTYYSNATYYSSDNLYGLLGSVNLNLIETTRIESGLRFELLTSFYKGSLECDGVQSGLYLGIKL